eukprot:2915386-Amphidinium_carterae.2
MPHRRSNPWRLSNDILIQTSEKRPKFVLVVCGFPDDSSSNFEGEAVINPPEVGQVGVNMSLGLRTIPQTDQAAGVLSPESRASNRRYRLDCYTVGRIEPVLQAAQQLLRGPLFLIGHIKWKPSQTSLSRSSLWDGVSKPSTNVVGL